MRRWWALVLAIAVAAGIASYPMVVRDTSPEARVEILVGPANPDFRTLKEAQRLIRLLEQDLLRQGLRPATLNPDQLEVSGDAINRLLTIRVRDKDPARAAAIANDLAEELELSSRGTFGPASRLRVVEPATSG